MTEEKQTAIRNALKDFKKATGLTVVKSALPVDISFSEIRYVLADRDKE